MIIIVDNRQDGAKRTVKNHSITRIQARTAYSDKKKFEGKLQRKRLAGQEY